MKNHFGLDNHPTDQLISWRTDAPKTTSAKLRTAYDAIVALGSEYEKHLLDLMDASRQSGINDELDSNDDCC